MTHSISTTGPALNAETILAALMGNDGTYSLSGQAYRGSGILVAIPEHGFVLRRGEGTIRARLTEWITSAAHAITSHPAPFYNPRYFGSWVDSDGTIYFDVVEAFPRENLSEAIAAGVSRNQIAIWDNGRKELIVTGGNGSV